LHLKSSTNPLGLSANLDKVRFYPKYVIKDIIGVVLVIYLLFDSSCTRPFDTIDAENYNEADYLSTPKHIKPEWYFLPFYGILRSIANKGHGVGAMFFAIISFLLLILFCFKSKSSNFCLLSKFIF